jgi:hypothetical protein
MLGEGKCKAPSSMPDTAKTNKTQKTNVARMLENWTNSCCILATSMENSMEVWSSNLKQNHHMV